MAGEWLDIHGGFQIAHVINPAFETQNALLGNFKTMLAGVVFLGAGGPALMIRAAASSLAVSPPGVLHLGFGVAGDWTGLLVKVLWISVQLAAPVTAATFLAEVATALINRALPQMHVLILALPAKALLAVCAVALTVPILVHALEAVFSDMGSDLMRVVRMMGG
jgi:flagellar biosynthetic protein FliR